MRILVLSNLYPPVARGGFEVECSGVVERLRESHEVLVLTTKLERASAGPEREVRRELAFLSDDWRGALRAPAVAPAAVRHARRALEWKPDLIYAWNVSSTPQAALRVLADSGVPLAFRVCSHVLADLFVEDQFLRELLPRSRGPARSLWSAGCRALNALPGMRLAPRAAVRMAIAWNSETMKRLVEPPAFVETAFERVIHSVPRHGGLYASVERDPGPEPEIAFVGRVTPFKGVAVAIEALARLRSEHGIGARLVVVGPEDREHGAQMRALARRLGVGEQVRWHGQSAPAQVAEVLARAHVLIVPSVWDEPFPLVTIEGALARVPLVASDVGGISEGMHADEHALLFPRGDSSAAAAALARTLREGESTAARVARARARAESFRLQPYLDEQELFVRDAQRALAALSPDDDVAGAGAGEDE